MYKRNYSLRIDITEEIFEIKSCIEFFWQMISKSTQLISACFAIFKHFTKRIQRCYDMTVNCFNLN